MHFRQFQCNSKQEAFLFATFLASTFAFGTFIVTPFPTAAVERTICACFGGSLKAAVQVQKGTVKEWTAGVANDKFAKWVAAHRTSGQRYSCRRICMSRNKVTVCEQADMYSKPEGIQKRKTGRM